MDTWKVRILHVSGLHARGPSDSNLFRFRRVLGEAWERNVDTMLEDGPIDAVCFTGNVADNGIAEEYEQATEFFDALLARLRLDKEQFFVVPGEHDIDAQREMAAWESFHRRRPQVDSLSISKWMAGEFSPSGFEPDLRERLLSRQSAYRCWLGAAFGRNELLSKHSPHKYLGFRITWPRSGERPFDIHFLGFDSAWASGRGAPGKS